MPRRMNPLAKKGFDLFGIINTGSANPSTGEQGELFYNTSDSTLYIRLSSTWVSIGSGGAVDGTFDFMDGNDLQFMDGNSAAYMSG